MNAVDVAVILVVLLSALVAFARGFVSEVLAVAAWIGAALATLYGFAHARPYVQEHIASPMLADAATAGGVFVLSLLILMIVSVQLSRLVRGSSLSAIDRSLGFLFGAVRGCVIVVLVYMIANAVFSEDAHPDWVREARSLPLVKKGEALILEMVPAGFLSPEGEAQPQDQEGDQIRRRKEAEDALRRSATLSPPPPPGAAPDTGYESSDRRNMEHLFKTTN